MAGFDVQQVVETDEEEGLTPLCEGALDGRIPPQVIITVHAPVAEAQP